MIVAGISLAFSSWLNRTPKFHVTGRISGSFDTNFKKVVKLVNYNWVCVLPKIPGFQTK